MVDYNKNPDEIDAFCENLFINARKKFRTAQPMIFLDKQFVFVRI